MSKTIKKNRSEVEHLRGEVRRLKRQLRQYEKTAHFYEPSEHDGEENEVDETLSTMQKLKPDCEKCHKGYMKYVMSLPTGKDLFQCENCDHRKSIWPGKK